MNPRTERMRLCRRAWSYHARGKFCSRRAGRRGTLGPPRLRAVAVRSRRRSSSIGPGGPRGSRGTAASFWGGVPVADVQADFEGCVAEASCGGRGAADDMHA